MKQSLKSIYILLYIFSLFLILLILIFIILLHLVCCRIIARDLITIPADAEESDEIKLQFFGPRDPQTLRLVLFVKSDSYVGFDMIQELDIVILPRDSVPNIEFNEEDADMEAEPSIFEQVSKREGGGEKERERNVVFTVY